MLVASSWSRSTLHVALPGPTPAPTQIINCLFTAAYSLYMRGAMDRVAQHTSDGKKLGEFSMVGGWSGWGAGLGRLAVIGRRV